MSKQTNTMHARDMQRLTAGQRAMRVISVSGTYLFLGLMALIVLFPFYWMIISSLKTLDEYRMSTPTFWPRVIMLSNYVDAFTTASLGRLFLNTMYVGLVSTLLSLAITILTAFAFARLEFKGKETLFALLLATMMIPGGCSSDWRSAPAARWFRTSSPASSSGSRPCAPSPGRSSGGGRRQP